MATKKTKKAGGASKSKKPVQRVEKEPAEPLKNVLPFEIDPKKIEESLQKMKEQVVYWAKKGRYTKVRVKFRGKQVIPDVPLAAFAVAEGASFYFAGLLRILVFNLAGRAVLDLEFVNDSEKKVQAGKEAILAGDLDKALALFREAIEMESNSAVAHLNLGIASKLKGSIEQAKAALHRAKELDPNGPIGAEASRLLGGMPITSVVQESDGR